MSKKQVVQEQKPETVANADPKEAAGGELTKSQADLATLDAEIAKNQQLIADTTTQIGSAVDVAGAQKLIVDRTAAQALVSEYLIPRREKLTAAVNAAQATVNHLNQQSRMDRLMAERVANQTALAFADDELKDELAKATDLALEISSRYTLLKTQMTEISALVAAGCSAQQTEALPVIQTVEEMIIENQKFGILEWAIAPVLKDKLNRAPIWKDEVQK
jgi:hypothetical protein